jgi:hypothetical protein
LLRPSLLLARKSIRTSSLKGATAARQVFAFRRLDPDRALSNASTIAQHSLIQGPRLCSGVRVKWRRAPPEYGGGGGA